MVFKEDGTFEGEVVYPKARDMNVKVSGTYALKNNTLTINNRSNNSTTRSTMKFEQDFLILTPENPEGFIAYYKRTN